MIIPLVSRMAARNRTRRVGDRRFETMDLWEIDTFATNAKHPEGVKDEQDKVILRLMQTGSSWTQQLTMKTGRAEVEACTLCGQKETKDHVWHSERLKDKGTSSIRTWPKPTQKISQTRCVWGWPVP